jgi:hypothetical protein
MSLFHHSHVASLAVRSGVAVMIGNWVLGAKCVCGVIVLTNLTCVHIVQRRKPCCGEQNPDKHRARATRSIRWSFVHEQLDPECDLEYVCVQFVEM